MSGAANGSTRTAKNGYHYTKKDDIWWLTHHLIAQENLGRPLKDGEERVKFKDGNRANLTHSNIEVIPIGTSSLRGRLARLEARRDECEAQIKILRAKLEKRNQES